MRIHPVLSPRPKNGKPLLRLIIMTNIKQNLYLPIFNALLISSLTALTACGGSGSGGNDISSVVSDSDGRMVVVIT